MSIMGLRRSTGGRYLRVGPTISWIISTGFWRDSLGWLDTGTWIDGA